MSITGISTDLFLDNRYVELFSVFNPKDVKLRRLKGTECIGEPFCYHVHLISRDPIRELLPALGTRMTVGLKLKDGTNRYFNGIVDKFRYVGIDDTRRTNYIAEVRCWLSLLDKRQNCRLFQNKTALEIIKAIFSEHPSALYQDDTDAAGMRVRPLCVQWNETDYAFISRLMEQEGIYYYFTHTQDLHKMVLVNRMSAHPACPGDDEIETHLNLQRAQIHNDMIWAFHESAELQPELVTLNDYNFEKPQTSLLKMEPVPQPAGDGSMTPPAGESKLEIYQYPGDYRESPDGSNYAKIHAEEIACRVARVKLEANARNLLPGHTFRAWNPFDMTDLLKTPEQSKRYLLLGGEFEVIGESDDAMNADEAPRFLYSCVAQALLATTQFRPPPRTSHPVIAGPQTALVVGVPGDDITTDKYGRIKVQFYWDREGQKNENSSCWIRVAQCWAGRGWGGLVTPRIGQEAVVQFLDGNPDWPIVTGVVYNAANPLPYDLPGQATRSTFKSRSSIGGAGSYNELRFEDQAGSEEVYLRAQKDFNGDVQNNFTVTSGATAKVTAKGSAVLEASAVPGGLLANSVEVTSEGMITISSSMNILLKVGPAGAPISSIEINEEGITLLCPEINLLAESGAILCSSIPIPIAP